MSMNCQLWMGSLEPNMTESFIMAAFHRLGSRPLTVKVMRNKFTGEPAGYAFIHFQTDEEAVETMHKLNGKAIPGTLPVVRFRLNTASREARSSMQQEREFSVWVGDLSPDVDDYSLYRVFASKYTTIKTAKVILDNAGYPKGYGFVRFGSEEEQRNALYSMNGYTGLGSKPLKICTAVPKPKGQTAPPTQATNTSTNTAYNSGTEHSQYYDPSAYWSNYSAWSGYYGQGGAVAAPTAATPQAASPAKACSDLELVGKASGMSTNGIESFSKPYTGKAVTTAETNSGERSASAETSSHVAPAKFGGKPIMVGGNKTCTRPMGTVLVKGKLGNPDPNLRSNPKKCGAGDTNPVNAFALAWDDVCQPKAKPKKKLNKKQRLRARQQAQVSVVAAAQSGTGSARGDKQSLHSGFIADNGKPAGMVPAVGTETANGANQKSNPVLKPCKNRSARAEEKARKHAKSELATAKRKHPDDTISLHGEAKKLRLVDSDWQPDFDMARRTEIGMVVTTPMSGLLDRAMAEKILLLIQKRILEEACSRKPGDTGPAFKGKPCFKDGSLRLLCADRRTVAWLRSAVSGQATSTGDPLVLRALSEMPKRVRCGLLIPDPQGVWDSPKSLVSVLAYQNPWAQCDTWFVYTSQKQKECWFLVFSIPATLVPTVLKQGRCLTCGIGSVYLKFQGPGGKFFELPTGKQMRAGNAGLQITGEELSGNKSTATEVPAHQEDYFIELKEGEAVEELSSDGGEPLHLPISNTVPPQQMNSANGWSSSCKSNGSGQALVHKKTLDVDQMNKEFLNPQLSLWDGLEASQWFPHEVIEAH